MVFSAFPGFFFWLRKVYLLVTNFGDEGRRKVGLQAVRAVSASGMIKNDAQLWCAVLAVTGKHGTTLGTQ
jgi:hypothetical protein